MQTIEIFGDRSTPEYTRALRALVSSACESMALEESRAYRQPYAHVGAYKRYVFEGAHSVYFCFREAF